MFMNGIQDSLQEKLARKRRKLEKLLNGIIQVKPRDETSDGNSNNNFAALSPKTQR